jgi:hypothetical protein
MSFPIQTLVINPAGEEKHTVGPLDAQVRLVNTDGTAFSAGSSAYELPAAGEDTLGGIKQYAPEQAIGNVDSNIAEAAADTPTKDEFDKLVTAFNTLAKQFDDTIAGLVSAGAVKLPDKK